MPELLLDQDISAGPLIDGLRQHGYALCTAYQLGQQAARDEQLLAFAARRGLLLVTRNAVHYTLLHRAWLLWPGDWGLLQPLAPTALANMLLVWNTRTGLWEHVTAA